MSTRPVGPASADPRHLVFSALWGATGLVVLAYAAGMFEYGIALWNGRYPMALDGLARGLPADMVYGRNGYPDFMADVYAVFSRNLHAMTLHILAGSTVLGLGLSQFIPGLRQRWPRVHRSLGLVVLVAMFGTVAGAIWRLAAESPAETYSGPGFHVVLWYLALASAFALIQAVLALRDHDYRQHMVWMAVAWSAFLTAPALRIDVMVLYRWYGGLHEPLNFSSGAFSWVGTALLMVLWLQFVGDRDLPARRPIASSWPTWLVSACAGVSAVFALHEGALAPLGLDVLAAVRGELALPVAAMPWALATALASSWSVDALASSFRGERPANRFLLASGASALGAFAIAANTPSDGLLTQPMNAAFLASGGVGLLLLAGAVLGGASSVGRHVWGVLQVFGTWSPVGVLAVWIASAFVGLRPDEGLAAGLVMAPAMLLTAGMATAYGARVRSGVPRSVVSGCAAVSSRGAP